MRTLLVFLVMTACASPAPAGDVPRTGGAQRLHAAVFLVRGSVAGAQKGSFGPFVREADTTWRRLSISNLYTFGFGEFRGRERRRLYVAAGNGLHRSDDDGRTWRIITGWQTMEVLGVLPDPADSARILIATPWGVYRTEDDGRSWEACMTGFRSWYVRSLTRDREDPERVFAVAEDDIYATTDRGGSWRGLKVSRDPVLAFFQHPGDPRTLMAGCEDGGIRRSTDGGRTWHDAACPARSSIYAFGGPADGRTLYAAGWQTGIWRSTDGGAVWAQVWQDPAIEGVFCFLVDPADAGHVFAGTDGNGVYESRDHGRTWSFAGLRGGKIKHLFLYP